MLAGVTVLCAGVTLGIIAGLGQTTSTAAASAIAGAAGIKVGTASFYLYGVFFLLQLTCCGANSSGSAASNCFPFWPTVPC